MAATPEHTPDSTTGDPMTDEQIIEAAAEAARLAARVTTGPADSESEHAWDDSRGRCVCGNPDALAARAATPAPADEDAMVRLLTEHYPVTYDGPCVCGDPLRITLETKNYNADYLRRRALAKHHAALLCALVSVPIERRSYLRGRREAFGAALRALDGHNFNDTAHDRVGRLIADEEVAEAEDCGHHSWAGLMDLLDQHWPADIFPSNPDPRTDEGRDPGPRIVSLIRWVDRLATDSADVTRTDTPAGPGPAHVAAEESARRLTEGTGSAGLGVDPLSQ